jgi:hypothetical protein
VGQTLARAPGRRAPEDRTEVESPRRTVPSTLERLPPFADARGQPVETDEMAASGAAPVLDRIVQQEVMMIRSSFRALLWRGLEAAAPIILAERIPEFTS